MRAWPSLFVALLSFALLAGCISGEERVETPHHPDEPTLMGNYTLPETITGVEDLGQIEFVLPDGTVIEEFRARGVWFHNDILYTSGEPGIGIIDVSDPAAPKPLAMVPATGSRDVDIMEHPNGGLYAVLAGSPGIIVVNVTDPAEAEVAAIVDIPFHNIAVVPGTTLVYNSRSIYAGPDIATQGGIVDIVDFTDLDAPEITPFRFGTTVQTAGGIVKVPKAPSCHDIAIYPDVDRAYCAGVTETQVWDISDPKAPVIMQIVDNPGTNIHHAAYAAKNHSLLIIGDELGGAAFSPGCTVSDQAYGGVWFVDISDLATPIPMGWWGPQEPHEEPITVNPNPGGTPSVRAPTCTAHFGNLIEDRDLLVIGFYTAGVFIVDFSDPSDPKEIANHRAGGSVWEGQYYRGHIYTGDGQRGVDVLRPTGDGEITYS